MGRIQVMMLEIGALLVISMIIRLIFSAYGVEESTFTQWFPILAALLIVYTVRFRIRKKISTKNQGDMDKPRKKE